MERKHKVLLSGLAIALIAVAFLLVTGWVTKTTGYAINEDSSATLANCLADKGDIVYCVRASAACDSQKEVFGSNFKLLNYVECAEGDLCGGLQSVPAWQINGEVFYGTKSLSDIKTLSGC